MSYTKIFSSNIKPKDVEKALSDFRKFGLDISELDSLNVLFKNGDSQVVNEIQQKIQHVLLKLKNMPKEQDDNVKFPIDLSVGYYINYYKLNMGNPELSATNSMISIQLGKTYEPRFFSWFGGIGIYAGVGFESSNIDLTYIYTNTIDESSHNSISFIGDNTFRGLIGAQMRILLVDVFIDYNIGASNTINAGFGKTF